MLKLHTNGSVLKGLIISTFGFFCVWHFLLAGRNFASKKKHVLNFISDALKKDLQDVQAAPIRTWKFTRDVIEVIGIRVSDL